MKGKTALRSNFFSERWKGLFVGAVFSPCIVTVLLRALAVSGSSAARLPPSPYITVGRDIVVGIAIRYGLDSSGIESRRERDFSHPAARPWGPPSLLCSGCRVIHRGEMSRAWGWQAAPSSAKVKERVELTSSPSGPLWTVLGWNFYLYFTLYTCITCSNYKFISLMFLNMDVREFDLSLLPNSVPLFDISWLVPTNRVESA
jgi:hypothetical protein